MEIRGATASTIEKTIPSGGFNLTNIVNAPVNWTPQGFAGFYYDLKDELGREELEILQTDLSKNQRAVGENNLVYRTTAQKKKLKVVNDGFNGSASAATEAGLEKVGSAFTSSGEYLIMGWQGEKYIAVNNKIDIISKLLFEHGATANEKKTLAVGEKWDIGDGWELIAQSIDAKASPRQVWLTLSYKGQKLDDKVVAQGKIYTYVEKSIAEESDVPMFVTKVDSVFAGADGDMAQLRFTWVVSRNVTKIKSGETIGAFKVKDINQTGLRLELKNEKIITLDQNAVIDLIGNIKLKVADKADVLRLYPKVDYEMASAKPATTSTITPIATPTIIETVATKALSITPTITSTPAINTPAPPEPRVTSTLEMPGFEAVFAISGLLAVAYLVLRK
ncbi:MAG: S-layer protein domain-containing protein [Candidatus Methanoperedens sp.]|nr:S-layer protein domain-containing protein [Candidatus Methanoperedens sp.]